MSSNFNNKDLLTKLNRILTVFAATVPADGIWVLNPGFISNNTGSSGTVLPIGSGTIRYPFNNNNTSRYMSLPFLPIGATEGTMGPATDNIPRCTGTPPNRGLGSPCCAEYKDNNPDKACIRFLVEIGPSGTPRIPKTPPQWGNPRVKTNPPGVVTPIWVSCVSIKVAGENVIQCTPIDDVYVVRIPPKAPPVHREVTPRVAPSGTRRPGGGGGFQGGRGGGLQP